MCAALNFTDGATMKDELVTGAELSRRLEINPSYLSNLKKDGKLNGCMRAKKYYFNKTCKALGRSPDNPTYSKNHNTIQKKKTNTTEKKPQEKKEIPKETKSFNSDADAKTLLEEIENAINDNTNTEDKALLDGLKLKASILKEYFLAKNEEIKNRKLEEDLFTKDEVLQVLSAAMSMIRNAMINTPNNYAVNLENADKATIKEYVTDDVNKILSDLQSVGKQFEKSNI